MDFGSTGMPTDRNNMRAIMFPESKMGSGHTGMRTARKNSRAVIKQVNFSMAFTENGIPMAKKVLRAPIRTGKKMVCGRPGTKMGINYMPRIIKPGRYMVNPRNFLSVAQKDSRGLTNKIKKTGYGRNGQNLDFWC